MPQHIIDLVQQLADKEGAPDLDVDGCPVFEWELGLPFDLPPPNPAPPPAAAPTDDDLSFDDSTYHPDDDSAFDPDDDAYSTSDYIDEFEDDDDSISDAHNNASDIPTQQPVAKSDTDDHQEIRSERNATNNNTDDQEIRSEDNETDNNKQHDNDDDEVSVEQLQEVINNLAHTIEEEVRSEPSANLRIEVDSANIVYNATRSRQQTTAPNIEQFAGYRYNTSLLQIGKDAFSKFESIKADIHQSSVKACFTQMNASKGIKLLGERAVAAIFKEYKQLNDLVTIGRVDINTLTHEQRKRALRAVNLIKIKRCGKVKGKACADGSSHRKYVPREEASSPTLFLEGLMSLLLINSYEGRDVAIFDVPGAYLHADIPEDKFVLLKFENEFVDIMCEVNPEFLQDVTYENGRKVLYVQILKAIYGMIESALLWYTLYTEVLHREGFEINPYDKCVANKSIDGKQCTLAWYVDDNMLSHKDPKVVDQVLKDIEEYFPGLVVERGTTLNFLGMEIDFFQPGKVKVGTVEYLKGMIEELTEELKQFEENIDRTYSTPAGKWFFKVNEKAAKLQIGKADIYRKFVAKLIWVMKRSRPDIEPSVSFLCTRVN